MYCRKCGFKNLEDANFCSKCGTKIVVDEPEDVEEYEYNKKSVNKIELNNNIKTQATAKKLNSNLHSSDYEDEIIDRNDEKKDDINSYDGMDLEENNSPKEKKRFSFFNRKSSDDNIDDQLDKLDEEMEKKEENHSYNKAVITSNSKFKNNEKIEVKNLNDEIDDDDDDDEILDRDEFENAPPKRSWFKKVFMVILLVLIAVAGLFTIKNIEKKNKDKAELSNIEEIKVTKDVAEYKKTMIVYVNKLEDQLTNFKETTGKLSILKTKNKYIDLDGYNQLIQSIANRVSGLKYYDNIPYTQNKISRVLNKLIDPPGELDYSYDLAVELNNESASISKIFKENIANYSKEELMVLIREFETNVSNYKLLTK